MSDTRRPLWVDATLLLLAGVLFVSMIALGNWQVHRLAWKLDLIDAIETRAYGDPVPAPEDVAPEYLRVTTTGTYAHDLSLRIKAVTELGPGYWIMTPLSTSGPTADGQTIWINRGFVPTSMDPGAWNEPAGQIQVTGLVRLTQPGGTLLESNQPENERWVSADLSAMNLASGLGNAQTGYFIDAERAGSEWPRGGLTRLVFRNSHLAYALTWYAMAALFFFAMAYVVRERIRPPDED